MVSLFSSSKLNSFVAQNRISIPTRKNGAKTSSADSTRRLEGKQGENEDGTEVTKCTSKKNIESGTAQLDSTRKSREKTKKKKGLGRRKSVEYLDVNYDGSKDVGVSIKETEEKALAKKTTSRRKSKRTSIRKPSNKKNKAYECRQSIACQLDTDCGSDDKNFAKQITSKVATTKKETGSDCAIKEAPAQRIQADKYLGEKRNGEILPLRFGYEDYDSIGDSDSSSQKSNSRGDDYNEKISRQLVSDGRGRWSISQEEPIRRSIFQAESSDDDSSSENYSSSDLSSTNHGTTTAVPRYETTSDCDGYEVGSSSDDDSQTNQAMESVFPRSNKVGLNYSYKKDRSSVDSSSEDDTYAASMQSMKEASLRHSVAKKRDSVPAIHPSSEAWSRPYISQYEVNDRWMLSVKRGEGEDVGLGLVFYRNELFVVDVEFGPFYKTAIDKGDKILKINGKKIPEDITSVTDAEELMNLKTKIILFVCRPHPDQDDGYQWIMKNF